MSTAVRSVPQQKRSVGTKQELSNQILASLPKSEFDKISPNLRPLSLKFGTVIREPDESFDSAYFLNSGLVSLLAVMKENRTAEVGLIGNEGVVGSPIILGTSKSTRRAISQASVTGYKMTARDFRNAFEHLPIFKEKLLKYVRVQLVMMSQIAACNGLHTVEQRLARWLLMCQDRLGAERLPFTHDFLADMLGVKRTTVTEVARVMLRAGLIDYSRGQITILKRRELEAKSCECYGIIKDSYASMHEN